MKRRTSALSLSAAAMLAAVPLLSGCGTDSHPGSAAVVGDHKISVSEVQADVEQVRDAQRAQPDADLLMANSNALPVERVEELVYGELVRQTAEEHQVTVSKRELARELSDTEAAFGGEEELAQAALSRLNITLDQFGDWVHTRMLVDGLIQKLGEEKAAEAISATADRLGVDVNPRYGQWDNDVSMLAVADTPWLAQPTDTLPG